MHGPGAGAAGMLMLSLALLSNALSACQPGMGTTPPVSPVPPLAFGLPIFFTPAPTVRKLEDPAGRPLTMTLEHDVRDVLEEAGFKLAVSEGAASGVVATLFIDHVEPIGTDLFIHGYEACGVRVDITRGDALLATAEPEVKCVSTSAYYGMLPKDAAVSMVNTASRAPALLAVAEAIHPQPPATDAATPTVARDGGR